MLEVGKELDSYLKGFLRKNMIQLFTIEGTESELGLNRHICQKLEEIPGADDKDRIANSIFISVYVYKIWLIHLKRSQFSLPFYGCVLIEKDWLDSGVGAPPYVVIVTKGCRDVKENGNFTKTDGIRYIMNIVGDLASDEELEFAKDQNGNIRISYTNQ